MEQKKSSIRIMSEEVLKRGDYFIFALQTCFILAAIVNFLWYWFFTTAGLKQPLIFMTLTCMLAVVLANNLGKWFLLPFMKKPCSVPVRAGWKVGVATTFVPGAESLKMLEETLAALVALDYPHDTWVLDEGDDHQVKALCDRLGAYHFTRKHSPHYQAESGKFQAKWKHGNFNSWLQEVAFQRYEILSVFDPDHVPVKSFLAHVLGYFEDSEIAYVQVAQAYYNQRASFIACGAAEEVYSYYSCVQMAGYGMGYPVVIGGHTTHRVAALKEVGGFPAHNADDVYITLLYRAAGWQGVYVPKILARGLTPVDWHGYLTQQRRWARSVLDIKLRIHPKLAKGLPVKTRIISLLHGINYLHKSLIFLMGLLFSCYLLISGIPPKFFSASVLARFAILIGVLQIGEFYRQKFYLDWRHEWGLHWRAGILQYAKWPFLLLALVDVAIDRKVSFSITSKVKDGGRRSMLLPVHSLIAGCIFTAWLIGYLLGHNTSLGLHMFAAFLVLGSGALMLSERLSFPEPYDGLLTPKDQYLNSNRFAWEKEPNV
jgi:cellulose synthase (UDP-forming)